MGLFMKSHSLLLPILLLFSPTSLKTPPLKITQSVSAEPDVSNGKGEGEGVRETSSEQVQSFARSESYREVGPAWPVSLSFRK